MSKWMSNAVPVGLLPIFLPLPSVLLSPLLFSELWSESLDERQFSRFQHEQCPRVEMERTIVPLNAAPTESRRIAR